MSYRTPLVAFLALSGCTPLPALHRPSPATPPTAAPPLAAPPDTAALARRVPHLIEATDVPGLSMAVVQDGRVVWAGAFGTVNDSAQTPLNTEAVFEAASLSKPVFAYIVLRLADRGEFDLDRPLFETLEYSRLAHDERYERITARMVLSHSTGLPNWGGDRLVLNFEPGTGYEYSGEGFVYLQKVIERATGLSLDELAQREVFRPLGMTRSSFVWQERFAGNAAFARNSLWNVASIVRYSEANAAATLLTTATDYAQFVAAVLTGRGLSPELWSEFLTPAQQTKPGVHFGLGVGIEDGPGGRVFFHSGNNGRRFTSYMLGDVERGIGLVYLSSAYDGITLAHALASPVLGEEHPALHRSGWDRYDDPLRLASKAVQRAAVRIGSDAARELFRATRTDPTGRLPLDDAVELGRMLAGRGLAELSIEVLEAAVADAPGSVRAHLALGTTLEAAGDMPAAIASYRRALAIEPENDEVLRKIHWADERMAAHSQPVTIPLRTLESYAGQYQDRHVILRDGRLFYRRGVNSESLLTPLAEDLFELGAGGAFRIRFVGDGRCPAMKLVGIYDDGRTDESMRSK